jgi:RNA polymerase sigma-70 factor, ECF subfamily
LPPSGGHRLPQANIVIDTRSGSKRGDVSKRNERQPRPENVARVLVGQVKRSDPDGWEGLYRDAYAPLLAYAARRLDSREAADEAVSEVFARAYERVDLFTRRNGGVHVWLFGILRDVVMDAQRASARRIALGEQDRADVSSGPADEVVPVEGNGHVRAAFERLSEEDRELLELRAVGGLGAKGVGTVVGRKPRAVRKSQSRALTRFRTLIAEESDGQ